MPTFTRYFNGLPWEVEQGIRDTEKSKHALEMGREVISEGSAVAPRLTVKVLFTETPAI